jgi:hypothetical protein
MASAGAVTREQRNSRMGVPERREQDETRRAMSSKILRGMDKKMKSAAGDLVERQLGDWGCTVS